MLHEPGQLLGGAGNVLRPSLVGGRMCGPAGGGASSLPRPLVCGSPHHVLYHCTVGKAVCVPLSPIPFTHLLSWCRSTHQVTSSRLAQFRYAGDRSSSFALSPRECTVSPAVVRWARLGPRGPPSPQVHEPLWCRVRGMMPISEVDAVSALWSSQS
ncbi:hypothetical protein NDU88_009234 [Pleurodeles waltl]|uniref:Uncharacterized protein n=1 Tax=Pleurodeles waltl TaxID=8319 RepID=A0AAV7PS61_PLEWA|nr:hypothetical protein NDU88_009234 [Pleurodeles waltl]